MQSNYVIETQQLTKRFGRQVVVDHLTLQVPRGSVFAFLGRNGAGKTTTVRMLLDLLDKTSGRPVYSGWMPCVAIRQRVGFVAQHEDLYDWMTVEQMIWFCQGFYPPGIRPSPLNCKQNYTYRQKRKSAP